MIERQFARIRQDVPRFPRGYDCLWMFYNMVLVADRMVRS